MSGAPFSVAGRVVAITGAGARGGIGHALALGFARAGARLALADCDADGLKTTAAELAALGAECCTAVTDIARAEDVAGFFAAIDDRFARVDALINVPFRFPARVAPHELSLADWEAALAVNVTGHFLCCQAAIERMLAQGEGGAIVNIGSNAGVRALGRGGLAYGCGKAALHHLTQELAVEYAASGIRCNAILPAQTRTPGLEEHLADPSFAARMLPQFLSGLPQGRLLEPQDFVGPALFLVSPAGAAVNGALLPVDGGHLAMVAGASPGPDRRVVAA